MDASGVNAFPSPRQMGLRSQGPVDPLEFTQLNPAGCYIRSYTHDQQCHVNASYHTVSLQIKERRRKLIEGIRTILGTDPHYWFPQPLRPVDLPLHPWDWSTSLLQWLCTFAQSLPCDTRNTTAEQRLDVAHQSMLNRAANSSGPDNSVNSTTSAHTRQVEKPSYNSSKDEELDQLRAKNLDLTNQVEAITEELTVPQLLNEIGDKEIDPGRFQNAATALPDCARELRETMEQNNWLERELAKRQLQDSNDAVQVVLSQLQQALGFS